jgi:hypothetical protein
VTPDGIPYPDGAKTFMVSPQTIAGLRPVIQSLTTETPSAKGDLLVIAQRSGGRVLLRARDSVDASATDSGFTQVGPTLPANVNRVQAAGGHSNPTFFVGDGTSLWRLDTDAAGTQSWKPLVSGSAATGSAVRFFVDPWNDQVVYRLDTDAVRRSDYRGDSWSVDRELSAAVTAGGSWPWGCSGHRCPLNDMAFDPNDRLRRFAAGVAGVFWTADGKHWQRLLDTRAIPSRPISLWFDPLTDPSDRTLLVANMGRSILRIHPIPDSGPVYLESVPWPRWDWSGGFDWQRFEELAKQPSSWALTGAADWRDESGRTGLVLAL